MHERRDQRWSTSNSLYCFSSNCCFLLTPEQPLYDCDLVACRCWSASILVASGFVIRPVFFTCVSFRFTSTSLAAASEWPSLASPVILLYALLLLFPIDVMPSLHSRHVDHRAFGHGRRGGGRRSWGWLTRHKKISPPISERSTDGITHAGGCRVGTSVVMHHIAACYGRRQLTIEVA